MLVSENLKPLISTQKMDVPMTEVYISGAQPAPIDNYKWVFQGPAKAKPQASLLETMRRLFTYRDRINLPVLVVIMGLDLYLFISYFTTHNNLDCIDTQNSLRDTVDAMKLRTSQQAIAIILICFYGLRAITTSQSSWMFLRNNYKEILVDGFTLYPLFLSLVVPRLHDLYIPNFLRIWSLMWHFRLLTFNPFLAKEALLVLKMIDVGGFLFTFIVCFVAGFKYLTNCYAPFPNPILDWSASIYFVIVTISTVGYGDITPKSELNRWFVVIIMFAIMYMIPTLFGAIEDIIHQQRITSQFYLGKGHIVVCGNIDTPLLENLYERLRFLHYLGLFEGHCVVLSPREPDDDQILLQSKLFMREHVVFVHGSCLDDLALQRVNAKHAKAIISLVDPTPEAIMTAKSEKYRLSSTLDILDLYNGQRAWAIKLFAPEVPLYVEFLRAENVYQLRKIENCKRIIPRSFCKYNLLAGACIVKGFSAFALNLCQVTESQVTVNSRPPGNKNPSWESEYMDGMKNNIHSCPVSRDYVGMSFDKLAILMYEYSQCMAFAVYKSGTSDNEPLYGSSEVPVTNRLQFNPGKYYMMEDDDHILFVGREAARFELAMRKPGSVAAHKFFDIQEESTELASSKYDGRSGAVSAKTDAFQTFVERKDNSPISMSCASKSKVGNYPRQSLLDISSYYPGPSPNAVEGEEGDADEDMSAEDRLEEEEEDIVVGYPDHPYPSCRINRCFITKKPRKLSTATFETSPGWENHIIIVGTGVPELFGILEILRFERLGADGYSVVVLMSPQPPTPYEWKCINRFPQVYCMIGNGHSKRDLYRAGVMTAKAIVSVGDLFTSHDDDTDGLEDALALLMLKKTKADMDHNPDLSVYLELVNESSVRFVSNGLPETSHMTVPGAGVYTEPSYASGNVVLATNSSHFVFQAALLPWAYDVFCCLLPGTENGSYL
eukprot:Ihof_evm5s216 gene=Ihof_evmTU5s216